MDTNREEAVKKMSELLKAGAVMLDNACPACSLPLFKLKSGEIVCPIHGTVKVVKSESEIVSVTTSMLLDDIESLITKILYKLKQSIEKGEAEADVDTARMLIHWLDVLERVKRIKSMGIGRETGK